MTKEQFPTRLEGIETCDGALGCLGHGRFPTRLEGIETTLLDRE